LGIRTGRRRSSERKVKRFTTEGTEIGTQRTQRKIRITQRHRDTQRFAEKERRLGRKNPHP
jgi:hypothetical protein